MRTNSSTQQRLTRDEGLRLLLDADLHELGESAQAARFARHPKPDVTFLIDSNPNYTNVCETDCLFCAFYRKPGSADAYTLTLDQVMAKIKFAAAQGATTVLLQGGHNAAIPFDYYLDLVRECRRRFPQVTPHFFTASEIQMMARVAGLTIRQVLERLKEAGMVSLPGGGAEVLSRRVRMRISPKKGGPESWLEVHRAAHQAGLRSTATMMYGHVETAEDILDHLDAVRALQDETGGFTAFIPWSFKPSNTVLEKKHPVGRGPVTYCRILALSRLYLDNVDHIQASWFSEGKKAGQVALHFGADDYGGTLLEENVHAAADHVNPAAAAPGQAGEAVALMIKESGFNPVQRTTLYETVRRW